MAISFLKLWENMQKDAEDIDTQAMKAIRTGLNVREDFWDDFIRVCNNSDDLAELLEVRPDQVSGWGENVRSNLDKVNKADSAGKGPEEPKTKIIDTGNLTKLGGISTGEL